MHWYWWTTAWLCIYRDLYEQYSPALHCTGAAFLSNWALLLLISFLLSIGMAMAIKSNRFVHLCFLLFVVSTVLLQTTDGRSWKKRPLRQPCRNLVLYFHDVLYNGKNAGNATSTLVGAPQGANLTLLSGKDNQFGDLAVFDDPITLDNNFHSPPVGRAQGFYLYDMKNTFSAWLGFTFVLNSTDHKGTITFGGADPILTKYRDISVVGGTGDFLMTRGIATVNTDSYEGDVYFRLRVNITLYECYWFCFLLLRLFSPSALHFYVHFSWVGVFFFMHEAPKCCSVQWNNVVLDQLLNNVFRSVGRPYPIYLRSRKNSMVIDSSLWWSRKNSMVIV